jgi:four helix bundle protein
MKPADLRERTKKFAIRIINLVAALPNNRLGDVIGKQVLRSGMSIGSNYREASRASTKRQFTYAMEIALREADETLYWLEIISEVKLLKPNRLTPLIDECNQLVSIFVASVRTSKNK